MAAGSLLSRFRPLPILFYHKIDSKKAGNPFLPVVCPKKNLEFRENFASACFFAPAVL